MRTTVFHSLDFDVFESSVFYLSAASNSALEYGWAMHYYCLTFWDQTRTTSKIILIMTSINTIGNCFNEN